MKAPEWMRALPWREDLNFLLTNRVPRRQLTRLMGRLSRIDNPLFARAAIALWRTFSDLDLSEARESSFRSIHACFTRELKPGLRPLASDPRVLSSPCDAIVGQHGTVVDGLVYQAKGFPYRVADLFGSEDAARPWQGGCYVTLRLTASMYHRFHAPNDGRLRHVTFISGDTWNVNPIALQRIERLFCRNERAALRLELAGGEPVALVAVAAILVASLRLHEPDLRLHMGYRGPKEIDCDHAFARGDELGWFEHGSTIIVFAPPGFSPVEGLATGSRVRMGEPLLRMTAP